MKKGQKVKVITSGIIPSGHWYYLGEVVKSTGKKEFGLDEFENSDGTQQLLQSKDFVLIDDAESEPSVGNDGK